jgi:hypothetical protein
MAEIIKKGRIAISMKAYLKSFYTKLAFIMGLVMYGSYAIPTDSCGSKYLIFVAAFVAIFLPFTQKGLCSSYRCTCASSGFA